MNVVHIIGIGGIGMSAIAEIMHHLDYTVQGSDTCSNYIANSNIVRLQKLGMKIYIGHDADNINQAQTIIYSSAIKPNNVELMAAQQSNRIVMHRSEILAELVKDRYTIAISGSCGKTTTTAMISSILDYAGIDATVIIGGIINAYKSNAKFGRDNIFLIEADESDGTMLKIPANIAVITSMYDDHIDHYGTFDNIKHSFHQFVSKAEHAILPDSIDIGYSGVTFGFNSADTQATNVRQYTNSVKFDVLATTKKTSMQDIVLPYISGLHKVSNALAAISVAEMLGINQENIKKGLLEFKGVEKRFSIIAEINGIKLIEDFTAHPAGIEATATAARSIAKKKVIGIIEQPHFMRVHNFFNGFIEVFKLFDYLIFTPTHPREYKSIPGCSIDDIQKVLMNDGFNNVKIMNDALLISHFISDCTNSGDIVLFIGGLGNIYGLARETAEFMRKINLKQTSQ